MPRRIGTGFRAVLASISGQGSDDSDSSFSGRGRSIDAFRSSYYPGRQYKDPFPIPKSKHSNSRSRSRSSHRTRRRNTNSLLEEKGEEGEKKLSVLGKMKADFKEGWDMRMREEEERVKRRELEMAMQKESERRMKRWKRASMREKREREMIEMERLEDGTRSLTLGRSIEREGREHIQHPHRFRIANSRTTPIIPIPADQPAKHQEDASKRLRMSRESISSRESGGSESSASTIGRGPIGDMNRTFVEGMIMPEQLREIERREKEKRMKEAESRWSKG